MSDGTNEIRTGDEFTARHIGPSDDDVRDRLATIGLDSLAQLIDRTVPRSIHSERPLDLPDPLSEADALARLATIVGKNKVFRSNIGLGYHDCLTPAVIRRNILENPGWYTQYTPYQPEISQGRLEALLNFQTMVTDLTGLEIANASLLDEATAAAEAMTMSYNLHKAGDTHAFFVSELCHPQTIEVLETRAWPLGIELVIGDHRRFDFSTPVFGVLLQYPASDGRLVDYREFCAAAHAADVVVTVAADLLALTMLRPPAEFGADIAIGSSQRFGVPLGNGGPHAAYFATRNAYQRKMPGRLVGVTVDTDGRPAYRLALQTREQHIRRERATSNICTAQVLLAVIASMYAVYHGPDGLRRISGRVHRLTRTLATGLRRLDLDCGDAPFFDTLRVELSDGQSDAIIRRAEAAGINLRRYDDGAIGVSLDETTSAVDVATLCRVVSGRDDLPFTVDELIAEESGDAPVGFDRTSSYLTHPVFHRYRSETEMLRYLRRLESRDLSLTTSMIPLGSCTMKLNAAAEMLPITWPELASIHPFAPADQTEGYLQLIGELEDWLSEMTGFAATSLQPNAGSQGEFAGLLVIRKYHESRSDGHRTICLIPQSAHGTNPASAIMAGMKVVVVQCDDQGNVDVDDLRAKAAMHAAELGALMVTYPSTHGVFEEAIREICDIVHEHGGQVYMDGANMNAQIGICRPGEFGPDVCHLNLHKTFCIPHGGGGPGIGPICVAEHLRSHLPGHRLTQLGGDGALGAVAAAPYGSASILPISWMYVQMMGAAGLRRATDVAILNANYIAKRLSGKYPVVYTGRDGFVAHECIVDIRPLRAGTDVSVEDIAKRLMDYGFHAPTMSWPVAGTLMIEPTESESKAELDRFCDAMLAIHAEIAEIRDEQADRKVNLLKMAPHTAQVIAADDWERPYARSRAAFPTAATREHKYWPPVGRVDNAHGDRHLVCTCVPIEDYE